LKLENLVHRAERIKRATQPVYIVQFWHIREYGLPFAYPFSRVFSSGYVKEPLQPVLECIESVTGGPAQIVPEQGRAAIGGFRFDCVDLDGEVLRYFSSPQLALLDAVSASAPGVGEALRLNDVSGLPAFGTIEVGPVGVAATLERIRYSAKDVSANSITVSGRGVDDTAALAHAVGTFVTNGEQIRSGQRCRLLSGYQTMVHSAFMESQRVEVVDRNTVDMIRASFTVDTADITRALRREVFLTATQDAPFVIGGHPLTIALQVLMSTGGAGTFGPYDVLAAENGLGIHPDFINVAEIEAARNEFPSDGYCFTITGPEMAKGWLEDQIFKTINAYPLVLEDGRLTVRLYTPVLT
jgi:hypothetical protein